MVPVGRGQRELIIGDRQTGKTSIAVDTILNQKGQNVICIYGQSARKLPLWRKSTTRWKKRAPWEYSILLPPLPASLPPLQYIAPYSGAAIAEYFMGQGKDVLIVYDDLSKARGCLPHTLPCF